MAKQTFQPPVIDRYETLNKTIHEGKKTFIEVGLAIGEVIERKLFLVAYENVEDWAEKEHGWTRQHATGLAKAAQAVKALPAGDAAKITSGNAAKAIAKVPEAMRPAVVSTVTAGGKPATAKAIKAATPKGPPPKKKSGPPKKKAAEPEVQKDRTGAIIPPGVQKLWDRSIEAQGLLTYISAIRSAIEKAEAFGDPANPKAMDPLYAEVDFQSVKSHLDQAYVDLKRAKAFAICPTCQGQDATKTTCAACKGRGFVSEFYWEHCVPEEIKKVREATNAKPTT